MKYLCISILRTVLEIIIEFYILNKFINKEDRKSKKLYIIIFIIIIGAIIGLGIVKSSNKYIIRHLILFITFMLMYNNRKRDVIISIGMMNILNMANYICANSIFYKGFYDFRYKAAGVLFEFLITFLLLKYSYIIIQLCNAVKRYMMGAEIILIINIVIDVFTKYYNIYYRRDGLFFITMLIISYIIFFFGGFMYIINANNISNTVMQLTKQLYVKNSELKDIKEDYEKQIYYLSYLTSIKRFDEAGEALESIINQRQNGTSQKDKTLKYENDIVYLIVNEICCEDVKIIVKEECDLSKTVIPNMELYRVMFNIVNNALKAMNNNGIIILKMYEEIDYAIITIENNGPKIECENINDIFKAGYTTKKNEDKSHGFGLSIVKDLVESYGGMISVRSDDMSTEFEISVPLEFCDDNDL